MIFDCKNILKSILSLLPPGRAYKKAFVPGTNFNKLMLFIAKCYERRCAIENEYYNGLFISESDFAIKKMRKDLGLPNQNIRDIAGFESEKLAEIFAYKNLMKDNTALGIQRVWNAFGIRAYVFSKNQYTIVIKSYVGAGDTFPLAFPVFFDPGVTLSKLQYITRQMIPAHCTLEFVSATEEESNEQYLDVEEPDFIYFKLNNKLVNIALKSNAENIEED